MKKLCLMCMLFYTVSSFACGKERWPVKTLKVPPGDRLIETSVEDLTWIIAPTGKDLYKAQATRFPEELDRYQVTAWAMGWFREDDKDYHLVIADEDNVQITMIAEMPDPACGPKDWAFTFGEVRSVLQTLWGVPTTDYKRFDHPHRITIWGYGFFDYLHGRNGGQIGAAKNAFELHPVTGICVDVDMIGVSQICAGKTGDD
jgi:hypothetical protein